MITVGTAIPKAWLIRVFTEMKIPLNVGTGTIIEIRSSRPSIPHSGDTSRSDALTTATSFLEWINFDLKLKRGLFQTTIATIGIRRLNWSTHRTNAARPSRVSRHSRYCNKNDKSLQFVQQPRLRFRKILFILLPRVATHADKRFSPVAPSSLFSGIAIKIPFLGEKLRPL